MSRVTTTRYYCDRCHEEQYHPNMFGVEPSDQRPITYSIVRSSYNHIPVTALDLCKKCQKVLMEFIGEQTNNPDEGTL